MKRSRGRNRRSGGNNQQNAFNNPNRHFESVGPDVKIRGSAQQVLEKYQQYARDAQTSGDRILSEAYFQYAEHYQRIVAKQLEARNQQQQQQHQNRGGGNGPRDERDPRGGQDRDPRGGPNDDAGVADEDEGEAEVVPAVVTRRNEDSDSDSLRVIDAEDDGDEAEASAPVEAEGRPDRERGNRRGGRKPYRPREDRPAREPVEPVSETDGVMKTLARGRRKPAPEESAAEQD